MADGAGGLGGGAVAARLVVEGVERLIREQGLSQVTTRRLCALHSRLDAELQQDSSAGESTAVVAVVRNDEILGASVGDSGAWVMRPDGACEVLTDGQYKWRLGSGRAKPLAFRATVVNSVVLAATDGLFRAAQPESIRRALQASPTPERMVELARSRSGKLYDDVGLVILTPG